MKKSNTIIIILILILLLAACAPRPDLPASSATVSTTLPAVTTAPTTNRPTTTVTAPVTVPLVISTIAEDAEMSAGNLQKIFTENPWYRLILYCTFETGDQIDTSTYFLWEWSPANLWYGPSTLTQKEREFAAKTWPDEKGRDIAWAATHKVSRSNVAAALALVNTTIENVTLPEGWVYYDQTDCYYEYDPYLYVFDTNWIKPDITNVVKNTDANGDTIVQVYWETTQSHYNTATKEKWPNGVKMVLTMKLSAGASEYVVLSNVPAE